MPVSQRAYVTKTEQEIRCGFALIFDRLVRAGQACDVGHHSEVLSFAALVYLFVNNKGGTKRRS